MYKQYTHIELSYSRYAGGSLKSVCVIQHTNGSIYDLKNVSITANRKRKSRKYSYFQV